jgi:hypothetical protein
MSYYTNVRAAITRNRYAPTNYPFHFHQCHHQQLNTLDFIIYATEGAIFSNGHNTIKSIVLIRSTPRCPRGKVKGSILSFARLMHSHDTIPEFHSLVTPKRLHAATLHRFALVLHRLRSKYKYPAHFHQWSINARIRSILSSSLHRVILSITIQIKVSCYGYPSR